MKDSSDTPMDDLPRHPRNEVIVELCFPSDTVERLKTMQRRASRKSITDVIVEALRIYELIIEQLYAGHRIVVEDTRGERTVIQFNIP